LNNRPIVEICVESTESAIAAERGGATRVEVCSALIEGGITPGAALVAQTRKKISIGLHVIIRPRGGDFCYTSAEFDTMQRDVLTAKDLGADGVVLGILRTDGTVDVQRTRQLVDIARPLQVTYHRAFDLAFDLLRSLEDVTQTGAERILTSGGAQTAVAGTPALRQLVEAADGRIIIMAAGGINPLNVQAIVEKSGVKEIHASLKSAVDCAIQSRNENISQGSLQDHEYRRFMVLEDQVRQLLLAASATGPSV
jgi:copper homeostasis protein